MHKKKGKGTSADMGMQKGHGHFANMPPEVEMKPYPSPNKSGDPHLDDTIVRLDGDTAQRRSTLAKNRPASMY